MITLHTILLIGHIIGVALGVGGATMSDVLFLTSISDRRFDKSELRLLKIASKVVTGGLVLLAITGIGFFFVGTETSPRFWAKFTIVMIAALNGNIMHTLLFPLFEKCATERTNLLATDFTRYAPLMVTAGTVSAISWYTALILGMWRTLPLTYWQILGAYVSLTTIAVIGANIMVKFLLQTISKRLVS